MYNGSLSFLSVSFLSLDLKFLVGTIFLLFFSISQNTENKSEQSSSQSNTLSCIVSLDKKQKTFKTKINLHYCETFLIVAILTIVNAVGIFSTNFHIFHIFKRT